MTPTGPLILAVVDDDDDVRIALSRLLRAMGHQVRLFASAEDFEAEQLAVDCVIAERFEYAQRLDYFDNVAIPFGCTWRAFRRDDDARTAALHSAH